MLSVPARVSTSASENQIRWKVEKMKIKENQVWGGWMLSVVENQARRRWKTEVDALGHWWWRGRHERGKKRDLRANLLSPTSGGDFSLASQGTNEMSLHINLPLMPCPFCSAKPKWIFIRFQFKCTWNWVLWEFRYLRMRLDWPVAIWQHQLSTRARISQEFQVKTPLALNLSKRSFF